MLQILILFLTTGGIASYARGRGGNPWLWGSLSVVGHLLIQFGGAFVLGILGRSTQEDLTWAIVVASWVWIGIVAFCARFLLGMSMEKPGGMWSCSNCRYLNQHYAVVCEACQRPYGKKSQSAGATGE